MATLDYTGDGSAVIPNLREGKLVLLKKTLKVADIIAADATMTANGYITAADVIQAIDVPAGFCFLNYWLVTITAGTAGGTANIGIAGSTEIDSAVALDSTAGTIAYLVVGDTWGGTSYDSHPFESADTIDFTTVANLAAGEWDLYVMGVVLDRVA